MATDDPPVLMCLQKFHSNMRHLQLLQDPFLILFTEGLFQHPFNAETVFHVKPQPKTSLKIHPEIPSISKTPCPKGLSISSSPIEAAGQLLQMTLKLVDDKDGGLIRMPRNTIRMED